MPGLHQTTRQATRGDQTVRMVLSSFVSPARAQRLAADVTAAGGALPEALSLLRGHYHASDSALVVALDAAVLPPSRIAGLVGLDLTEVHERLDDEHATSPSAGMVPTVPRRIEVARRVVRAIWIVLAIAVVAAVVQARGGVLPCPDALCIDWVDVALDDGTAIAATNRSVFEPGEVEAVRFRHRAPDPWVGTVRWTADGEELLASRVTLRGSGVLTVDWPQARLPVGVHVVTLVDGPAGASVTFAVERR